MRSVDKNRRFILIGLFSLAAAGTGLAPGCGGLDAGQGPDPAALAKSDHGGGGSGGGGGGGTGLAPLSSVPVQQISDPDVADHAALVRLGKALFWDVQVGGDGKTACASCHFQGGADARLLNTLNPGPDGIFASGGVTGAGQLFHASNITNDNRVGSQGLVHKMFVGIDPNNAADICTDAPGGLFGSDRRVTVRNAPSVVSAIFFRETFWDGRGNGMFNGLSPFGSTGNAAPGIVSFANGALASQAVGPVNSDVEMSCTGRVFNNADPVGHPNISVADKLLPRKPLALQTIAADDSVLGGLAANSYQDMVNAAFDGNVAGSASAQFSRVFGEAIQAYEASLVPDQTPLDNFLRGDAAALSAGQQRGMTTFTGKGNCSHCHAGAELSDATLSFAALHGLINEDGGDQGFHNIGVRPTAEDIGRAGAGPKGVSFSEGGSPMDQGAFKTPALRNVGLTAPYFHNGGKATLADVVAFYNRGGDFANPEKASRIQPRHLTDAEQADLVDFLREGLTDCRTAKQAAPFDHPSLPSFTSQDPGVDQETDLPATGQNGTTDPTGICN